MVNSCWWALTRFASPRALTAYQAGHFNKGGFKNHLTTAVFCPKLGQVGLALGLGACVLARVFGHLGCGFAGRLGFRLELAVGIGERLFHPMWVVLYHRNLPNSEPDCYSGRASFRYQKPSPPPARLSMHASKTERAGSPCRMYYSGSGQPWRGKWRASAPSSGPAVGRRRVIETLGWH